MLITLNTVFTAEIRSYEAYCSGSREESVILPRYVTRPTIYDQMARGIKIYEVFRASCIPYDDIIERGLTKDGGNICAEISGLIRSFNGLPCYF